MSEHARDPLEALRRAWSALEPPELDPEADDERTRAVVGALQRAWRELPVPAAPIPERLRAARSSRAAPWLVRAAAAVVLVGLGALLWRAGTGPVPDRAPSRASAQADGAAGATGAAGAAGDVVVVAVDSEHLELRSGNVRLVLLSPHPAPERELHE